MSRVSTSAVEEGIRRQLNAVGFENVPDEILQALYRELEATRIKPSSEKPPRPNTARVSGPTEIQGTESFRSNRLHAAIPSAVPSSSGEISSEESPYKNVMPYAISPKKSEPESHLKEYNDDDIADEGEDRIDRIIATARELEEKYGVQGTPANYFTLNAPSAHAPMYYDFSNSKTFDHEDEEEDREMGRHTTTSSSAHRHRQTVPPTSLDYVETEYGSEARGREETGRVLKPIHNFGEARREKGIPGAAQAKQSTRERKRPQSARTHVEKQVAVNRPQTARGKRTEDVGCIRRPKEVSDTKPKKYHDPVKAYQRMQETWKRDTFLSGRRKAAASSGVPIMRQQPETHRRDVNKFRNNYVIPSEKRRDNVRWETRARLLQVDQPTIVRGQRTPNGYVPPTDKRSGAS